MRCIGGIELSLHNLYVVRDNYRFTLYASPTGLAPGTEYEKLTYDDTVWDVHYYNIPMGVPMNSSDIPDLVDMRIHKRDDLGDVVFRYFMRDSMGFNILLSNKTVRIVDLCSFNELFQYCNSLLKFDSYDFPKIDMSNVQSLDYTFRSCKKLRQVDLSGFNLKSLVSMKGTFQGCSELFRVNLSGINFGNVDTGISGLFYEEGTRNICMSLTFLIIENIKDNIFGIVADFINNFVAARETDKKTNTSADILVSEDIVEDVRSIVDGFCIKGQKVLDKYKINVICQKDIRRSLANRKSNKSRVLSDLVLSTKISLVSDIGDMLSRGVNKSDVLKVLHSSGKYSISDIADALQWLNLSGDIVDLYYSKYIKPLLEVYLPENSGVKSDYTIDEVARILYKKYPENIVNKCIIRYLKNQYVV